MREKFQIPNGIQNTEYRIRRLSRLPSAFRNSIFHIPYSVFRIPFRISNFVIILLAFTFLFPAPALAANLTTSADIRSAVTLANEKGWCAVKETLKGDCKKRQTLCNDSEWAEFIQDNVEFRNGAPFVRQGTGVLGVAGTLLNPVTGIVAHTAGGERVTQGEELPAGVYTYLIKDVRNRSRIIPFTEATCFCACNAGDPDIRCKGKGTGAPANFFGDELFTREECERACANENRVMAEKCAGSLALIETLDIESAEGQAAAAAAETASNINALCFTRSECSDQDGIFEKWDECKDGKGRCYAKEPVIALNTPIGSVKEIQGLGSYIVTVFRYMVSILAIATTVMFVYGAFQYLLGSAIPSISRGKETMIDAIMGMLLVLGSTAILRTLNPEILNLNPIKLYMVNTVRFVNAASCADLDPGLKLADAGTQDSAKSYEEVSGAEGAFSVSPKRAACGHMYFVEGAVGQPCEGAYCEDPAEACVSCANAALSECQGVPGTRKVCAKVEFAGTVNYADGRFPEVVYLIMVCGYAQGSSFEVTEDNISIAYTMSLEGMARTVGSVKTIKEVNGQAMYAFDLDEAELREAANACAGGGNAFRGALLGVQYNDDTNLGGRAVQALSELRSIGFQDDMAILSKQNCGGGTGFFSGYASGANVDKPDLVRAIQCGFAKGRLQNPSLEYWSLDELLRAARGQGPITCDFSVSEKNAPSNPGSLPSLCPAGE
jgi:hypothetical protein